MEQALTILYRGPLASCNYGCGYCPFAKRRDTAEQLAEDRQCLERFVEWAESRSPTALAVLFTPWGEALTRRWYREAMLRLSRLPHVRRVAAQTNLSMPLEWLAGSDRSRIALWCTYHPGEVARDDFVGQCRTLTELGVCYSVGVVGLLEHLAEIHALRDELPADVYLWVNAYKRIDGYYTDELLDDLTAVDPLFPVNAQRHASRGEFCRAGETAIAVDGSGDVRRCHFISDVIGNIYDPQFERCLLRRRCTNETCGCHIGYVHLERLGLYDVFGDNVLERIPARWNALTAEQPAGPESYLPAWQLPTEGNRS